MQCYYVSVCRSIGKICGYRLGIGEVVRYWKAPKENRRAALATDSSLESYDLFAEP